MAISDYRPDPNEVVYGSFTRGELEKAFNAVQNPENWKMPIRATINSSDVEVTSAAICFYAGGCARVVQMLEGGSKSVIVAPGYYRLIGA